VGRVSCSEHGLQTGPLCCKHVLRALARQAQLPPGNAIEFCVDMLDDQSTVVSYIVCPECAASFELKAGQMLPGEYFAETKLPWAAPSCDKCVTAWRDRAQQ
jgi:hypothetical protein